MNRRSLSIIVLLIAVFAGAWMYRGMKNESLTGQSYYATSDCDDGNACTNDFGFGNYGAETVDCINTPMNEGSLECCAQDPSYQGCATCPEEQSGYPPDCVCDNGGDPLNNCNVDPCTEWDWYKKPECNECLQGNCTEEEKCSGACATDFGDGTKERCAGKEYEEGERLEKCSCAGYPDADPECKVIGLGQCKNDDSSIGPCCNGECKLTQCSDGRPNQERSPYSGREFDDGKADKEDWACKDCEECFLAGEDSKYDASKDSEYDECHDSDAPTKVFQTLPGSPARVAQGESFLSRFIAQFTAPPDDDKRVAFCADQGSLALSVYDPINKVYRFASGQNNQCVQCATVPVIGCFENSALDAILKKIDQDCAKGKANIPNATNVKNEKDPDAKAARIAELEQGFDIRCERLKQEARDKDQAASRTKATNWCQVQCADPDVWKAQQMEFAGGIVPDELQNLCRAQCFCGCAPVQDPPNEANKEKIAARSDDPVDKPIDSVSECVARCYHDVDWKASNAKNIDACRADCMGMFCAAPDPVKTQAGTTGGRSGAGGNDVCYGQFWNGCQYDLCEIMSWYGQDCGFNPPDLPTIGGTNGGPTGDPNRNPNTTPKSSVGTTGQTDGTNGGPTGDPPQTPGNSSSGNKSVGSSRSSSVGSSRSPGASSRATLSSSSRSSSLSRSTSRSSVPLFTRSSSRHSSRSSSRFSAYSSYLQVLACPPDACALNNNAGTTFCAQQGMACVSSNDIPCIRCVTGDFSSSSFGDIPFSASSAISFSSRPLQCGNGIVDAGEECDDGNLSNFDSCTTACRRIGTSSVPILASSSSFSRDLFALRFCGNNVLNEGEQCDLGADNSDLPNASCRTDCSLSRCGDQIVDGIRGEQCDDGNAIAGDGCSASCTLEQFAGNPSSASVLPGSLIELPFVPGIPNQANVLPNVPVHGPVGDTGPEAIVIMAAGASAGYTWMKMRKKKR